MLAYALGARGTVLVFSVLIGAYPVAVVIAAVSVQIFAPDLVPTGEFRSILYGSGNAGDDSGVDREAEVDPKLARLVRIIVNGGLLIGFLALIVSSAGLFRLERSIYEFVPGLGIRYGPRAFPVTVRINDDGLSFKNGSGRPWTCTSTIGIENVVAPSFTLNAAETRFFPYSIFRSATFPLSAQDGYWNARTRITVECLDDLGFSHYAVF